MPATGGRILMLAPAMPADSGNGLAMRAGFFLDAYSRRFDVDLVVAPVAGPADVSAFARSRAKTIKILSLERLDSHFLLAASVRDPLARIEAIRHYGKPSLAAHIGPISRALASLVENDYAAVHVFRLYLAELATPWLERRRSDRPPLLLDCDENDALVYRRLAALRRRCDPIEAALRELEADALARFAAMWLPRFDLVMAASDREIRSFAGLARREAVIPNVVELPVSRPRRRPGKRFSILFVGNLNYAPNADAMIWFVSRVWKRLQKMMNFQARLLIIGANPPRAVARLRAVRGVEVTGAVANLAPFYQQADLAIVPIRAGGGTRIKIIEAAAHGVPLVVTRIAAEGTTFQPGVDMLVADHHASFLRACLLLAQDRAMASRLATQARAKVKRDYSPAYWRARVSQVIAESDVPPPRRGAKVSPASVVC
jgi:glycosyltransferase involved in cell wall biosynthesis